MRGRTHTSSKAGKTVCDGEDVCIHVGVVNRHLASTVRKAFFTLRSSVLTSAKVPSDPVSQVWKGTLAPWHRDDIRGYPFEVGTT